MAPARAATLASMMPSTALLAGMRYCPVAECARGLQTQAPLIASKLRRHDGRHASASSPPVLIMAPMLIMAPVMSSRGIAVAPVTTPHPPVVPSVVPSVPEPRSSRRSSWQAEHSVPRARAAHCPCQEAGCHSGCRPLPAPAPMHSLAALASALALRWRRQRGWGRWRHQF